MTVEWPKHAGPMFLSHNEHKLYHSTVAHECAEERHGYEDDCWVSEEEKAAAIRTNECWRLQWYPFTPVSCEIVTGHSLDAVLKAAVAVSGAEPVIEALVTP